MANEKATVRPSAGAMRAARTLIGNDKRYLYVHGTGWLEQLDIAEIIDRETAFQPLCDALEGLLECSCREDGCASEDMLCERRKALAALKLAKWW